MRIFNEKICFVLLISAFFCVSAFAQTYTIQQYLTIRSASSPALSNDGKKLAYLTNVSGTSQIWMMDLPSGTPKQITNYDDNACFVRWSPAGNVLVFGKAKGGVVEYKLYDDEGHGISKIKNRLELYPLVADFLDKYMK